MYLLTKKKIDSEIIPSVIMKLILIVITIISVISSPLLADEFIVAPDGDDANPGTLQKPFRTIQKTANIMKPGDICYIRSGVYRETVKVRTSGKAGRPIRFAAYSDDTVTLSGTELIKADWSVYKGNIYKASINHQVSQLFVDGKVMVEARWPNQPWEKRWDKSTWCFAAKGSEYGKIVDPELAKTGVDWTGALAVLNKNQYPI